MKKISINSFTELYEKTYSDYLINRENFQNQNYFIECD